MAKTQVIAPVPQTAAVAPKDRPLYVKALDGETDGAALARTALRSDVHGARTRQTFLAQDDASIGDHVDALEKQIAAVHAGDMKGPEAMLVSQAAALDAIFHHLATRAYRNFSTRPERADAYLKSALKAQGQCQATLRTLGELKNPRQVAFIKQQNNAAGHQQVNNGEPVAHTRTHEKDLGRANELLTDRMDGQYATTLDAGTKGRAGRRNKALATVGVIDGTANDSR
jgi:hypothetical protein